MMKTISKAILGIAAGIILLFTTTAFIISDPEPDFIKNEVELTDQISISDINTEHSTIGSFKSIVKFKQKNSDASTKEFYGQEFIVSDNPKVDRILVGVTNNLISRVEIWNQNKLIETKELGFMDKMTWGGNSNNSSCFLRPDKHQIFRKKQAFYEIFQWNRVFW